MAIRLMPVADGDTGMDLILADGRRFPVNTVDDFYGFLRRFGRLLRYVPFALLGRTGCWRCSTSSRSCGRRAS